VHMYDIKTLFFSRVGPVSVGTRWNSSIVLNIIFHITFTGTAYMIEKKMQ
jgi:hypothetical protein